MILRTELRRSAAPLVGIGFAVAALGLLYGLSGPWGKGSAPWDEQWIGLALWPRYLMTFLWPLVLGAAAWQGLRDRRSRVTELVATTPRPAWRRAVPLLGAFTLALLAGYAVLLVVGGVQVATHASYFTVKVLPAAGVLVLALVGTAALGVGIGRTLPSLLTPPVVAAAALALQISTLPNEWTMLLTPTLGSVDVNLFTTVAPTVTLTQALWFIGIGATGFGLVVAARTRDRLIALLPIAVAAGIAAPALSTTDSTLVPDPVARQLVCEDNICVMRAHEGYLSALVGPARSALAQLEKLPQPPTRVEEVMANEDFHPTPAGTVAIFADSDPTRTSTGGSTDPEVLELAVISNGITPLCEVTPVSWEAAIDDAVTRAVAAGWVTGRLRPVPGDNYIWEDERDRYEQTWQAFRALPAAEQRARVLALHDAAQDCPTDLPSIVDEP